MYCISRDKLRDSDGFSMGYNRGMTATTGNLIVSAASGG
jgi:hypothetical protein